MFTGLVQEIGTIRRVETAGGAGDLRLTIAFQTIERSRLGLGASICVDGVCLTVAALDGDGFTADVSGETLRITTLGSKKAGARVNLEPSLRAGDSLGGHWVSGHVDGVADRELHEPQLRPFHPPRAHRAVERGLARGVGGETLVSEADHDRGDERDDCRRREVLERGLGDQRGCNGVRGHDVVPRLR